MRLLERIIVFLALCLCVSFAVAVFTTLGAQAHEEPQCPRHESGQWTASHPRECDDEQ